MQLIYTKFTFIVIFTLLNLVNFLSCAKKLGLYKKSDEVFILEPSNFQSSVLESESSWVVEFYNSWCGHCVKFAPKWKEFAIEHAGWWPVVRVGAVDCANENNTELCRTYNIKGFPSFKLFPPHGLGKAEEPTFHEQDPETIEMKVLDFLSNTTAFELPQSWPRIIPIGSMQDIWEETKDEHYHVAFVFERPGSYVGRQVILDTYRYKPLLVRRMLDGDVKKFGITSFPSLYLINRDGTFTRIAKSDNTREGMVLALKELLTAEQIKAGDKYIEQRPRNQLGFDDSKSMELEPIADNQEVRAGVYMKDLESTLHYCLRQEIAIHREIGGEKLSALRQFLKVLAKYFPGREEVVEFLEKVYDWLSHVGTEITGDQWINRLDKIQSLDVYLPERIEWVGCAGSEPRFRGYPCGMWTLFHTLTVAAYQKQRENPKDLPLDVLGAIEGYMKHFFGCQICVQNFQKGASYLTPADRTPKGAVLWLWQGHNRANNRLHGDETEDPKHPKIQFPSEKMCPACRNGKIFDNDKIFEFLINFYGKSGIISVADNTHAKGDENIDSTAANDDNRLDWWELHQRKNDLEKIRALRQRKYEKLKMKKENKLAKFAVIEKDGTLQYEGQEKDGLDLEVKRSGFLHGLGVSNIDMSLCVVFYLLCFVIISFIYYHFIVRRRHKPWSVLW